MSKRRYDTEQEAVEAVLKENNIDMEDSGFCRDLTAYSKDGTRCAFFYDIGNEVERKFFLIVLLKKRNGWVDWIFSEFTNGEDAIDMMCNADAYLYI